MQQSPRPANDAGRSGGNGEGKERGFAEPPSIALPKGGGAIRGIGEKFSANPVTGTGSMTVPIATSPGRSGFGPQLLLSYDSGAGNGPFGFGWSLSLPAITRKTDKGLPRYRDAEESDEFILSGAEDLVPVPTPKPERTVNGKTYTIQRYRPRVEGLFARIERWTNDADVHWRSISKENVLTIYGQESNARITDPDGPGRIFSWLISESRDDKGNAIVYRYQEEDGVGVDLTHAHERNRGARDAKKRSANRYLKRIYYGNRKPLLDEDGKRPAFLTQAQLDEAPWMFEVVFDYGEHDEADPKPNYLGEWPCRSDPFSSYRAGFEVRTYRLCQRVLMFHHFPVELGTPDCLVRSTDFTYSYEEEPENARNPVFSFLRSVTQFGYNPQKNAKKSLPPLEFKYSKPVVSEEVHDVDADSAANLPHGLDNGRYRWVDLDGEGLSGILTEQAEGWFYKRNLSPLRLTPRDDRQTELLSPGRGTLHARFGQLEQVIRKPSTATLGGAHQQFLDLAGDGQLDLVDLDGPVAGYYERTHDEDWAVCTPFTSLPVLDWGNPNLRFVDLTGDGHADSLISEDGVFCWHPSMAEAGYGPPERVINALDEEEGPRIVFADGTQSVYLADMSGDGLTDLMRIRNGEVCYWPNLGYGRFGGKVTMDHVPWFDAPDQFEQSRVRLADIDGSGVTDIIYLGRDGVRLYFNQSGNSWSTLQLLPAFPAVDDLASIQAVDLLGNGTACLVWSSPLPGDARRPMRYIDLMGGQKPHLLISVGFLAWQQTEPEVVNIDRPPDTLLRGAGLTGSGGQPVQLPKTTNAYATALEKSQYSYRLICDLHDPEFTALRRRPFFFQDAVRTFFVVPEKVYALQADWASVESHAHPDHIAGLKHFQNARVVITRTEFDFWTAAETQSKLENGELYGLGPFEKLMAAYVREHLGAVNNLSLLDRPTEIEHGILVVPAPGHTAGHAAVLVSSGRQQLLYVADAVIHPAQFEKPEWTSAFDLSREETVSTRKQLLDRAASDRCLVAGFHLPGAVGAVEARQTRFRWEPLAAC